MRRKTRKMVVTKRIKKDKRLTRRRLSKGFQRQHSSSQSMVKQPQKTFLMINMGISVRLFQKLKKMTLRIKVKKREIRQQLDEKNSSTSTKKKTMLVMMEKTLALIFQMA